MGDTTILKSDTSKLDLKAYRDEKVVFVKEVSAPEFHEEHPGNNEVPVEGTIFVTYNPDGQPTGRAISRGVAEGAAIAEGLRVCSLN
jgi:hypothetical protein